jgi:hypothetical protein
MAYMDRITKSYPLTRDDLIVRNPEIGGKINLTDEDLAILGVYDVLPKSADIPITPYQKLTETAPVEINGIWYQTWMAVDLTPEELEIAKDRERETIRENLRNQPPQVLIYTNTGNVKLAPIPDPMNPKFHDGITYDIGNIYVNGSQVMEPVIVASSNVMHLSSSTLVIHNGGVVTETNDNLLVTANTISVKQEQISVTLDNIVVTGSNLITASGNISMVSPIPPLEIRYLNLMSNEVPEQEYQTYLQALEDFIKSNFDPFDDIPPASPLYMLPPGT